MNDQRRLLFMTVREQEEDYTLETIATVVWITADEEWELTLFI